MSGKIYYGLHFYPGIAQYNNADGTSYKILLKEDTLRKMDSTFPGKPAFVEHVNDVPKDRDKLKNQADAWVIESFFNPPDGKHWTKFITVTDEADSAIAQGYKLSNAYHPATDNTPGIWNGMDYDAEVVDGVYEHLAITKNPRYNESVIMTPDEFKSYNENLNKELMRISNSKKEDKKMSIKESIMNIFYTKKKIENSADLGDTFVTLPKSGKEYSIMQIINAMDDFEEKKKTNEADYNMKVKLHDGTICNVSDLIDKHKKLSNKIKNKEDKKDEMENEDDEEKEKEKEMKEKKENEKDCYGKMENEDEDEDEDKETKKKALEIAEHEEKEMKEKKMKNSNKHFSESLKNAHLTEEKIENRLYTNSDKVLMGKSLFGSK